MLVLAVTPDSHVSDGGHIGQQRSFLLPFSTPHAGIEVDKIDPCFLRQQFHFRDLPKVGVLGILDGEPKVLAHRTQSHSDAEVIDGVCCGYLGKVYWSL